MSTSQTRTPLLGRGAGVRFWQNKKIPRRVAAVGGLGGKITMVGAEGLNYPPVLTTVNKYMA
jgi:hypothetical protein